jgi:hypothetical protein
MPESDNRFASSIGEFQKTAPILRKTATNKADVLPADNTQRDSPIVA